MGGYTKVIYIADWNGHRVVYSKCSRKEREFKERCMHGMRMMEQLQSDFVTRLIGVCYERLEMVTAYYKHGTFTYLDKVLGTVPELSLHSDIKTRFQLSVDYVKITNYLHHSPMGVRVMCDSHTLSRTLSQYLITDEFHLIVNDLDNLPEVNHTEGKLIRCVRREMHNDFVAPEQKWPYAPKPFNAQLMPPYDEKTDIWKIPAVVIKLLGNAKGSSFAKSQLREVFDRCRRIDPQQRPGAKEVLQVFLRVQELIKGN